MKTLGRLTVGQLNDLERLSMKELNNFVGGSACFWNSMGYVFTFTDDDPDNDGDADAAKAAGDAYRDLWGSLGGPVNENGDPSPQHKDELFKFLHGAFNTTGSSWETSGWDNMIKGSNLGMALVMIGDENNQHAHIISGSVHYEHLPNCNSRAYYVDESQNKTRVYVDEIRYGTGLNKK